MRKKIGRAATFADPRQFELFDDLGRDDPLIVFYRKIRKAGGWLTYDVAEKRVYAGHDNGVLGLWVVAGMRLLHDRIVADLMRVEHGVEPQDEPEPLDGGAVLHRLPSRRSPEHEPPVRPKRTTAPAHRGPAGAA